MLRNSNDQRNLRLNGILNGFATVRSSDKDSSSIGLELLLGLFQVWQKWKTQMLALFTRRNSAHDVGAIL